MMNKVFLLIGIATFLMGCAATQQAIQDYKTGASTPLVNGEVSPGQQAAVIQTTAASLPIPFSGPVAVGLGFLATVFFTWKRGVSIRQSGGAPAPTAATSSAATNGILQDAANIFSGMFTTASTTAPTVTGSVFQRVWKVALATVASGVTLAASDPSFMQYLLAHPMLDAIFVGSTAGIAGLEKALSSVPAAPIVPVSPAAPAGGLA